MSVDVGYYFSRKGTSGVFSTYEMKRYTLPRKVRPTHYVHVVYVVLLFGFVNVITCYIIPERYYYAGSIYISGHVTT